MRQKFKVENIIFIHATLHINHNRFWASTYKIFSYIGLLSTKEKHPRCTQTSTLRLERLTPTGIYLTPESVTSVNISLENIWGDNKPPCQVPFPNRHPVDNELREFCGEDNTADCCITSQVSEHQIIVLILLLSLLKMKYRHLTKS